MSYRWFIPLKFYYYYLCLFYLVLLPYFWQPNRKRLAYLGNEWSTMFRQKLVRKVSLLVANCCDDVLCLFRHFIQKEIDNAEASLSDMDLLLWAKVVGDVGEVRANNGKCYDEAILGGKLEAHLKKKINLTITSRLFQPVYELRGTISNFCRRCFKMFNRRTINCNH